MEREEAIREQQRLDQEAARAAEDLALRKAAGARADKQFAFERAQEGEKHRMPGVISREQYDAVKEFPELAGDMTITPEAEMTAEGPVQEGEQAEVGEQLGEYTAPETITSVGGSKFQADRKAAEERQDIKDREFASREAIAKAKLEADAKADAQRAEDLNMRHSDRMAADRDRMHQQWQIAQLTASFRRDPWVDTRMKEISARYDDEMRMYDAQLNAGQITPEKHAERTQAVMAKREAEVGRLLGDNSQSRSGAAAAAAGQPDLTGTVVKIERGPDGRLRRR
jgi:hypothetical protein